jgi:hypothetical protein
MAKLHDWDVYCVNPHLATMIHHAKSIISDGWEVKENSHQLSDYAQNTIEEILAFTDLAEKDLKLAMALTSKPYLNLPWK